jgi:hypothetical protein
LSVIYRRCHSASISLLLGFPIQSLRSGNCIMNGAPLLARRLTLGAFSLPIDEHNRPKE